MSDETKITVLPIGVMETGELITIEQLTAERDQFRDTVTDQVKTIQQLTAERDALYASRDTQRDRVRVLTVENDRLRAELAERETDCKRLKSDRDFWGDVAKNRVTEAEDNLAELVKAAEAHVQEERATEHAYPISRTLDALELALKRFKRQP